MTRAKHTVAVPVAGGDLTVGVWDADASGAPTIVAIHGVTSSHLAWELLAEALPGVRVVAPDLRGRGRSNTLEGPAGMAAHAEDLAAMFRALGLESALVVAHSMGAFVGVTLAARHPDLVSRLVLVDGGLPLGAPAGLTPDELVAAILGPTAARLDLRFGDVEDYLDFWRGHPAFVDDWSPQLEEYLAYDLVPAEQGTMRPATSYATTVEDTIDMNTTTTIADSLAALQRPTMLITVPRGLQNEEPGLYAEPHLGAVLADNPAIAHERWDGLNHYTVVMSATGAQRLAGVVQQQLALV
ncbi:MAG: alpha/beta hydrolase [Microbacterium sp. SCN 70-200]|uniref:alpha/beta hydrolase n=1 Tax=unclassified Microbacterium TaxID=2609290 RepID=UPI00086D45D3|nr:MULTISPECIES: alpha/beta hydrolase [unclassified Microbacterium]MBN9214463.1 alpha/beta hydrolase [Microbacterium sp.]ODT40815.1 MAG: alpha/beta hydrolase [Microbacterium sp. SCN 70-200]OJV84146.1 MAG: alpha/beta hydrolase [Microbacterium sp. 70-16]